MSNGHAAQEPSNSKPTTESDDKWTSDRKCPECGKFVAKPSMIMNGLDEVLRCTGICKKHGTVNIEWEFL